MAWNTPSTWIAGAVLTAAQLNAQVRDNFRAIGDPWTAYTPAWTAATTNPVIGNGTIVGAYMQAGKLVHGSILITMGSTTTYGSGNYFFSLPVPARSGSAVGPISGWANGLSWPLFGRGGSTTTIALYRGSDMAAIGSGAGFANTHRIEIGFAYEAA